jgi:chromosome partitioning protein
MVILAVVNQKGGVGKTTVALGLAAVAGRRGLDTIVVDLDPQANATSGMGVWSSPVTVDHALAAERPGAVAEAIVESAWDPSLFVKTPRLVPSSPALSQREPQLANDPIGAQDRLHIAMSGVEADLVIIDCPPSLGLLTVNALFAADAVAIVSEPAAWSTDGVEQILRNVSRIQERRDGSPRIAGIVVNRLARTRDGRYWDAQLLEAHHGMVVRPAIRLRAAVAEAAAQSMPLHALARDGITDAVAEFDAVLDALLGPAATITLPTAQLAGVTAEASPFGDLYGRV